MPPFEGRKVNKGAKELKRKILSILFALVLVLSFNIVGSMPVSAATLNVPSALYPTIQSAINAASAGGDTIIVAAGTYNEAITINRANLTLQSAAKWGAIIRPPGQLFGGEIYQC